MAKPVDWIGPFIEAELAAVIAWWTNNESSRTATNNSDSRFENDGSNFRSTVKASDLPFVPLVQISEVVSYKFPPEIIITDGHTKIRAKLSEPAAQVLESEIGAKIDAGTKGDVISIKEAILASTPYGPQDEHIQLQIQEIEYMYHLRKSLGHKQTILNRNEAARLLNELTEIRNGQYDVPESQAISSRPNANTVAGASCNDEHSQANDIDRPQSQQSMSPFHRSPPAMSQASYGTQPGIATQLPLSRKRKAPPMVEDGLEVLQENDLARPHGPGFGSPSARPLPTKRPQLGNDETRLRMINLLGNQSKNVPLQRSATVEEQIPPESEPRSTPSSPTDVANVPDISGDVGQMSIVSAEEAPAAAVDQVTSNSRVRSHTAPQRYSRRRIPLDQKNLLEKQDSWVPSLPGKQFPQPNIPIQLLTQWHAQAELENQSMTQAEPTTMETPMETPDSPESSDGGISQWSETPPRELPQLPPDSSIGSNNRSSPLTERTRLQRGSLQSALQEEVQLPLDSSTGSSTHSSPVTKQTQRSLGGPNSSQLASRERQQLPPDSTMSGSNRSSPVTKQTQTSLGGSHAPPMKKQHVLQDDTIQSSAHASTSSQNGERALGSTQSVSPNRKQSLGRTAIASVKRTPQSKVNAQCTPDKLNETSRPLTSGSIVKGTQLQSGDDMEMEMSVPRSLKRAPEQNPSVAHRRERSKHLKSLQRMHWLQTTYDFNPSIETLAFATILAAYKSTHPNDNEIRPSEFVESVKEAFPQLYPNGSDDAVGGLQPKGAKVPNVRASPIEEDVLMSNTDIPTAGAATNLRGVSAEPAWGVVVDLSVDEGRERSQRSIFVTPEPKTGADHHRITSSASWGYANPVATDKDIEMLPPPAHVLNSDEYRNIPRPGEKPEEAKDAVGKMESLKSMEKHIGKEKADEATTLAGKKRRQRKSGDFEQAGGSWEQSVIGESEEAEESRKQSRWGEFEKAMRNVRPGGAFAGGRGRSSGGAHGRLDVLDWDV